MSYQLIYNHQLRKFNRGDQSGILVKSQDMPVRLEEIVLTICRVTAKADSPLKYTYRVVEVDTGEYHILSCTSCSGIHNLILTPEEITKIRSNANRPTPAGIMLALANNKFWKADTNRPSLYCEEPRLAASALPEADFQATWKHFTGHKNNARAFLTPPYNRECLILIPEEASSEDILRLLHESDWLSSLRGWGKTFTTMAQMGDSFEVLARICIPKSIANTPEGAVWCQQAPVLDLSTPFLLQEPQKQHEINTKAAEKEFAERNAYYHLPYVYQECPDEDIYNIPPSYHPLLRWSAYIIGLGLLGICVHFMVGETTDDASKITRKAIDAMAQDDILQLKELTKEPYTPDSITRALDKLYAHLSAPSSTEPDSDKEHMRDIIFIIKHADTDTSGHADNIMKLRECAMALKLAPDTLSKLYMIEATRAYSVQDWENNLSPTELKRWNTLLQQAPKLRHVLQDAQLAPYTKKILRTNDLKAPTEEKHSSPPKNATETKVQSFTCVEGEPIPDFFAQALQRAPLILQNGNWSIIRRFAGTMKRSRFTGELDTRGHFLRLERLAEDSYHIVPALCDIGIPTLQFKIKDGKLHDLQCEGGNPAAASIPIHEETELILLPHRALKLYPKQASAPPPPEQLDLELREQDIVLQKTTGHLNIATHKGFPWTRMLSELPLQQDQAILHLPILTCTNKLESIPQNKDSAYAWSYSKLSTSNTASDLYDCHLLRIYDFSPILKQNFHTQANTYCMGEKDESDDFYSLASLYALSLDAEQEDKLAKAVETLLRLCSHHEFGVLMKKIFRSEPALQFTVNEFSVDKATKLLSDASVRHSIRKCILATLSESVRQTYTLYYNEEISKSSNRHLPAMELCLQRVRINAQGELVWVFHLHEEPQQQ